MCDARCDFDAGVQVWSYLLRNFEFEMLDPVPEPDYSCLVVGPKPCKVKFMRKTPMTA